MKVISLRKGAVIVVFLLFSVIELQAQERIRAKIMDSETLTEVPGVHVVNVNDDQGTVSDIDGNFSIVAFPGDSIFLSSVGYQPRYYVVGDSVMEKSVKLLIDPATIELSSVNVFAYKSERDFKNAVIALQLPEEKTTKLVIPGFYYGPKKEVSAGVGSPISFLVSKFGKKAKQEKRFKAAKERDAYRNLINSKYNKEIVEKITGLKAEALKEFMDQCTLSDTFIENANEYDIIVAINNCFEEYQNNN